MFRAHVQGKLATVVLGACLALTALGGLQGIPAARAHAYSPHCVANPGTTPDVIVGDLYEKLRHGTTGGITAFSIGTISCNVGKCNLNWISTTNDHPVIGQNMFRLKDGRFEQIGQSWLKHGFTALTGNFCNPPGTSCQSPGSGSYLGVNCSDPYSASLNGSQTRLGPKFEVNAAAGDFPYPATNQSQTGNSIFKRLQVKNVDLDPALNAGAQYWVEGQYVTWDDADSGNHKNNASYRPIIVSGASGVFDITLTGSTQREHVAIEAWKVEDPSVTLTASSITGDGVIYVAAKATQSGPSTWHYEYAIQNYTSHRAIGTVSVPMPAGATVTNIGFHDVDYHSGEPIVGTDWPGAYSGSAVTWSTEPYPINQNANSLRWGTLYNYRFDANVPPTSGIVTLGVWRPGSPTLLTVSTAVPSGCVVNGICGAGESCGTCAFDCVNQGGGGGCCGNATCETGETICACLSDCGPAPATETSCSNTLDDDCDGLTDCGDTNCCQSVSCAAGDGDGDTYAVVCDCDDSNETVYPGAAQLCDGLNNNCSDPGYPAVPANEVDADTDGVRPCAGDCNNSNGSIWSTPGEARNLTVTYNIGSQTCTIAWTAPLAPGGTTTHYDTLRSESPGDFVTLPGATCLETDGANTTSVDVGAPVPGLVSYLVRARNACPSGLGPAGFDSSGIPRPARTCP